MTVGNTVVARFSYRGGGFTAPPDLVFAGLGELEFPIVTARPTHDNQAENCQEGAEKG